MASENFRAKDISLKAQKKLLSRMSNKKTIKIFIDDKSSAILDNTYKLFKHYTGNKKEAEKLIKSIIKTIIKIGILHRNDQFNDRELKIGDKLISSFQKLVMTITSFYELEYSYDCCYIQFLLNDLHLNLRLLIENHLTKKSLNRLYHVFQFISKKDFLDSIFCKESQYKDIMNKIVKEINIILDEEKD